MPWASRDSRVPIAGSPGEALLSDPGDKRPEMGYLRVATRRTEANADRNESALYG